MIDISDINITRDVYSLWRMTLLTKFTAQLATRPWDSGPQRKRSFVYRWPSRVTNTLQTCLSRFAADDTYSQCNELLNSILFTPTKDCTCGHVIRSFSFIMSTQLDRHKLLITMNVQLHLQRSPISTIMITDIADYHFMFFSVNFCSI